MRIIGQEFADRYEHTRAAVDRELKLDSPGACIICGAPDTTCTHDRSTGATSDG